MINIKYKLTPQNLPEATEELAALEKNLKERNSILEKIRLKFNESDAAILLKHFCDMGMTGVTFREENGYVFVAVSENNLRKEYRQHQPQQLPCDRTLNLLLGSKILTEWEKRKLLADCGLIKSVEKEKA